MDKRLSQCGHYAEKEGEGKYIFRVFVQTSFMDGTYITKSLLI